MSTETQAIALAEVAIVDAGKRARDRQIEAFLARAMQATLQAWGEKKPNKRLGDQLAERAALIRIHGVISVSSWYSAIKDKWKTEPEIVLHLDASLDRDGKNYRITVESRFPASATLEERETKLSYYLRGDDDSRVLLAWDPETVKARYIEFATLSARLREIKNELGYTLGAHLA